MQRALSVVSAIAVLASAPPARSASLAVRDRGAWHVWWNANAAPSHWTAADPALTHAITWHAESNGLESAELRIAAAMPASRLRLILLRIDPRAFSWKLVEHRTADGSAAWQAEDTPPAAAFALNAGQFSRVKSWGWIIADGIEKQKPGTGPLSSAFVIDSSGAADIIGSSAIPAGASRYAIAFQSYPTLLTDNGDVPSQIQNEGSGVDLTHRDSRLAVGMLRDGRILLVLTRFDIGDGILRPVPIGPTTPEMAAIMGGLGCARAVMLDGGISSQLIFRDSQHNNHIWSAYRWVPLGLVATPHR